MSDVKKALDNITAPVSIEKPKSTEAPPQEVSVPKKKVLSEKQKEALKKGQETRLKNLEAKRQAIINGEQIPTSVKENIPFEKSKSSKTKLKKVDDLEVILKKLTELENIKKENIKVEQPKEELTKPPEIPVSQNYEKQEEKPKEELPPPKVEVEAPKEETQMTEINKVFVGRHLVKSVNNIGQFRLNNKIVGKENPFNRR
jgi:hypothetical protein